MVELNEYFCESFYVVRWLDFICKFHGCSIKATKSFTQSFNGTKVLVGDIELSITKEIISQATGLPTAREKWHKTLC